MSSASSLASIQAPPVALRAGALARARTAARARAPVVPRAAASSPPMSGIGACHAGAFLSVEEKAHLEKIAAAIGTPGKGITACDEGPGTIGDRFEAVGVENTEENRRAYRQVLFESKGASDYLSAAILDPETLYQKSSSNGELFPKVLMDAGIVPGVKPHLKVYALPGQSGATVMQGLDPPRCGARSTRRRGASLPSGARRRDRRRRPALRLDDRGEHARPGAVRADLPGGGPGAHRRARHLAQGRPRPGDRDARQRQGAGGALPPDEPARRLHGGRDPEVQHGELGKDCKQSYTVDEIAEANLQVFRRCFPTAMVTANFRPAGRAWRRGGAPGRHQQTKNSQGPWNLSFSWSAAIQMPLFQLCKGKDGLQLEEMGALYMKELAVASAAALGQHQRQKGEGDHKGKGLFK